MAYPKFKPVCCGIKALLGTEYGMCEQFVAGPLMSLSQLSQTQNSKTLSHYAILQCPSRILYRAFGEDTLRSHLPFTVTPMKQNFFQEVGSLKTKIKEIDVRVSVQMLANGSDPAGKVSIVENVSTVAFFFYLILNKNI